MDPEISMAVGFFGEKFVVFLFSSRRLTIGMYYLIP